MARAALLLECAYFVNRCNRGDWPNWMKLNLPGFCQGGMLPARSQPSGYRKNLMLQKTAGRLFHQWAEVCQMFSFNIFVPFELSWNLELNSDESFGTGFEFFVICIQ